MAENERDRVKETDGAQIGDPCGVELNAVAGAVQQQATDGAPAKKKSKRRWIIVLVAIPVCWAFLMMVVYGALYLFFTFRTSKTVETENGKSVYEYYRGLDRVKTKTDYDTDGRMIKQTTYDDEGMLYSYTDYIYDKDGLLTEERKYTFERLSHIKKYEYDEEGRMIREYEYAGTGILEGRREYEYEEGGDRVRWDYYDSSGNLKESCDYYSL